MYANVRGVLSKKPSIKNIIGIKNPDIIIFTETHLVGKATLKIEGYGQTITRNRKEKGGGLLLTIKNETDIEAIILNIDEKHEMMWVKLKVKEQSYIVCVAYGYAAESRVDDETIDDWYFMMEKGISKYQDEKVVIIGDLNAHIGNDEMGITENNSDINQNGRKLRSLVERRNLYIINGTTKCEGTWTREDPSGSKSILDYVIANENSIDNLENMVIDEEHEFKISRFQKTKRGSTEKPSDHNTIFFELHGRKSKTTAKSKQWNFKNEESMKKYHEDTENIIMKETWEEGGDINLKYKKWEKQVKSTMYKNIHRVTIKNKISNDTIKKEMGMKREINKEIKELQRGNKPKRIIEELKQESINIVDKINEEIEKEKSSKLKARLEKYIYDKNSMRNDIWKIRKKCLQKTDQKMAIKGKDGEMLSTKDEIHKEYENYFKRVLTNRKIKEEYEAYEAEINKQIEICKSIKKHDQEKINNPITEQEVRKVIKSLKAGKSPGQDELGNEIFMNAGSNLIKNLVKMFNYFWKSETIPEELMKITIKTIYKGKGDTSDLNNQRGLFLSSCVLKIYEKVILNRITPKLENGVFTEFQGGGRPNRSTRDQLFILRSIIEHKIYSKEKLVLQFMDLSKAFDKMVLRNILNNLWNANIRGKIWRIIYEINKYARLTISTPFGKTNEITCQEILKQGSVLASTLAAMHVDSVHNHFDLENLGIYYGDVKIENLLFQDDIVRLEGEEDHLNKANIVFEIFQNINKMEFHPIKTKVMIVNSTQDDEIKLAKDKLEKVNKMKYLGDIITNNGKIDELIAERKNSISGITAELVTILAQIDSDLKITSILQYIQGIIIPKMLVNSETWNNISQKNLEEMERIQMKAIKRTLKIPDSTPNMGLLNELGMLTINNEITKRKILYLHSILNGKNKITKDILKQQMEIPGPTWIHNVTSIMNEMKITTDLEEFMEISKNKIKKIIKDKIWEKQLKELNIYIENSKKCKKISANIKKPNEYLTKMSPTNAKTILLTKLGMIDIKTNFKNKYQDNKCTFCKDEEETLEHIVSCKKVEVDRGIFEMMRGNGVYEMIYGNDIDSLERVARVIENIMEEREKMKEEIESMEKPYTLNLDKTLPLNDQSENMVERLSFGCSKRSLGAEDAVDHHEV